MEKDQKISSGSSREILTFPFVIVSGIVVLHFNPLQILKYLHTIMNSKNYRNANLTQRRVSLIHHTLCIVVQSKIFQNQRKPFLFIFFCIMYLYINVCVCLLFPFLLNFNDILM